MITALPDETTLYEAAQQACASHLHLVIHDGQVKLTPILLPDMQKIAVRDKQMQEAA